jgi:cation transport regulator ChaB
MMKVWKLTPIGQNLGVTIRAETEERARTIANTAFSAMPKTENDEDDKEDDNYQPSTWGKFAWHDINAVSCIYQRDDLSGQEGILSVD